MTWERWTKFINGDPSENMLISEMDFGNVGFVFFVGWMRTQSISGDVSENHLISEMKHCCFINIRMYGNPA